jgi:hypothetical protein
MTVQGHGWDDNTGYPAFRNLIINGGFDVWQRGTSFTAASLTSPYYTVDRWITVRGGLAAGATWSRQTSDLTNFNYFMRCQRDSGNTSTANIHASTSFETVNIKRLQGKVLTLSFWAKAGANYSSASSSFKAQIAVGTGTDSNYLITGFTSSSLLLDSTVTLTTSWQRFTVTTSSALLTTHNQLAINFFNTPVGTASAADYVDITGVQLEAGPVATPFEFEPFETTLRKCQRYYEKSYSVGTVPGTNTNEGSFFIWNSTQSDALAGVYQKFAVNKRTKPTTIFYWTPSGTAGSWDYLRSGTSGVAAVTLLDSGETGFSAYHNTGGANTTCRSAGHWTCSAEL